MTDLHEVVQQCLRNNPKAQKILYESFAPAMLGVCYRYATQEAEAHDMLQEGFVRVFRKLEQWRGEGELGAWIRRIMVHSALNWLRDHHKMKLTDIQQVHENHLPVAEAGAIPALQAKDLANMLQQLPAGYRAVFNLFAVEGMSHAEIAEMLQVTESTSRSQYLRARRMLGQWLEDAQKTKKSTYAGTDR